MRNIFKDCKTSVSPLWKMCCPSQTILVFRCAAHYIDCLIKELGIDNLLGNLTYTPTPLTNKEILDSLVFLWIIQQRWRIGSNVTSDFINYTRVLTGSPILQSLPNSSRIIFLNQRSKPDFRITVTIANQRLIWIRCEFWKLLKIC